MNSGEGLPLISIIVPIYRVENELHRCVESLMGQTYRDIEIILIDDGSPDRCPELCDGYAKTDRRVIVIHKGNGGLADARNAGLEIASGEYVMYVDSDDYLEIDACERLLTGMDGDVDFVVGACREVRPNGEGFQKHTNIEPGRKYTAKDFVIESIKKNEWFAPVWLNLYRRHFLVEHGLYFKKGWIFEDLQLLPRLYLEAKEVVYVDYCFYNYVIRTGSIMTGGNLKLKAEMTVGIFQEWLDLLEKEQDSEFKRYLYGALVRYYMAGARRYKILGWKIDRINSISAFRYAIGIKDKLKVVFFSLFPWLYVRTI